MGLFDKFKSKSHVDFFEKYKPSEDCVKPKAEILNACKSSGFPDELITFISKYGFGNYGNGIIKIVNPEDYMSGLYTWLGKEDFSKIPFMITGFGDIFYFRNLGDNEYDISLLDIHYRNITVPAYSFEEFLSYITSPETEEKVLRKELFESATQKFGELSAEEIFFFVPALVLGGAENIKYIDKGKADVHHHVLFQMN